MKELVVILGAGESGVGAAILAKDRGYDVFVSDFGTISEKYLRTLQQENIPFEQQTHTMERILSASLVVKSPGIGEHTPVMRAIRAASIPVVSEIEFAGRFSSSRMICITGSNGKTTTTLLTHHILRSAGIDAGLAGNVGRSLALQVAREPHPVYVIELSSFQLDDMYDFRADIAVMLNITPDHLDRYDHRMENYVEAKFRILRNTGPGQAFVYWAGDPVMKQRMERGIPPVSLYPFDAHPAPGLTAFADGGHITVHAGKYGLEMDRDRLSLPGIHNLYNSLAAATVACLMDIHPDDIARALADFPAVEHRLEPVCELDGVRYINDSKATNVDSTYYALGSMTTPTVLILGGKDKGNDYSQILPAVREKVRAIVAMGLDNDKIVDFFSPSVPVESTHSLEQAIEACRRLAHKGDTVLLSPCCASFDLFTSYEDRGRRFKQAVRSLADRKEDI